MKISVTQKKDLKLRSFSVLQLYNNIYQFNKPSTGMKILYLIIAISFLVVMFQFYKEVNPEILYGSAIASMFSTYPSRFNEANYRKYLIKYLMKESKNE